MEITLSIFKLFIILCEYYDEQGQTKDENTEMKNLDDWEQTSDGFVKPPEEETSFVDNLPDAKPKAVITEKSILSALKPPTSPAPTPTPPAPKPTPKPEPTPPARKPEPGIKGWIKQQLRNIANLLLKLADKMLIALPGIIGSVFRKTRTN